MSFRSMLCENGKRLFSGPSPEETRMLARTEELRPIHGSDNHSTLKMPVQQRQLRGVQQRDGELAEVIRGMTSCFHTQRAEARYSRPG